MSERPYTFKVELLKELKESEFQKLGLSKNPFLPYIPKEINSTFVNRKEETRLLVRYIPNILEGSVPLLVITGSKGLGKTHFIKYICSELNSISKETGHKAEILDVDSFQKLYTQFVNQEIKNPIVFFLDDCEKIWERYKNEFVEIIDSHSSLVKIIAVWNTGKWNQIKNDSFYSSLKPVCVKLEKVSIADLVEIARIRVKSCCLTNSPFAEEALQFLAEFADGVPYSMIYYSEKILHFALDKERGSINKVLVEQFINSLNVNNFNLSSLTKAQERSLKAILSLSTSGKRGATSQEIAGILDVTRPAIISHLKILVDKKILDTRMENQRKEYFIRPIYLQKVEIYYNENE